MGCKTSSRLICNGAPLVLFHWLSLTNFSESKYVVFRLLSILYLSVYHDWLGMLSYFKKSVLSYYEHKNILIYYNFYATMLVSSHELETKAINNLQVKRSIRWCDHGTSKAAHAWPRAPHSPLFVFATQELRSQPQIRPPVRSTYARTPQILPWRSPPSSPVAARIQSIPRSYCRRRRVDRSTGRHASGRWPR
jgi:hypothetical protein